MPQHQQLDVLQVQTTATPDECAKQSPEREVEEGENHAADPPRPPRKRRDTTNGTVHDALERAGIDAAAARRNLVVTGLTLSDLVDRRFQIGQVVCVGRRLCEPCDYLERLTKPGVLRSLVHTGLRADILTTGQINRGDTIQPLDHEPTDTPSQA